jgi:hypothetical protein
VYARRLLGLAAAEHDPADLPRARAHQRGALALAEELGMRPLVARCHLGLGRLARRAGDAAAAERHFREARARLQEMGMTFWLDRLGQDQAAGAPRPEV